MEKEKQIQDLAQELEGAWSSESNEAVNITLLSPQGGEIATFNPKFTYPIYGQEETIFGYQGLRIDILFAADDMTPCVNVSYEKKIQKVGEVEAEDVKKALKEFLPKDAFTQDRETYLKSLQSRVEKFTPPGSLVTSYISGAKTFEIWRSSLQDQRCRALLGNMQILTSLFIEGGTPLDLEDEEWTTNRWEVFFLYEKRADSYIIVGYCTLYRYYLFDKTQAHLSRVRLSQFLIVPSMQRKGHGSRFYDAIIAEYLQAPEVYEVTVEDPSEEFSDLRDLRDLVRLNRDPDFSSISLQRVIKKEFPFDKILKQSKMPRRQFLRMMEIELLRKLDKNDKKAYKAFRIWVKTRLYKHNMDVLAQMDRLERIDKLEQVYFSVEDDYLRLMENMKGHKHGLEDGASGSAGLGDETSGADSSGERPAKRVKV